MVLTWISTSAHVWRFHYVLARSALIWVAGSGSGSRRAKLTHKNRKKYRIFMFWSAGCSFLRAEDFFCSLGVLYGGLGISKLQFLIKKIKIKISCCKLFSTLGHQTRIRIRIRIKSMRIRNPGFGKSSISWALFFFTDSRGGEQGAGAEQRGRLWRGAQHWQHLHRQHER